MSNDLRYDGRVAIITGAGNGLGRAHALLLASRGAKVVVNDLGGSTRGEGKSSAAADKVVEEIRAAGGEAVANYDSVEDGAKIVQTAIDAFGRLDIVVNNAGILRDVTFQKMTQDDWDLVYRVHVLGAFRVTHAAWPKLRDQGYGRIIFTASAAGIYGNFGQANYSMAKLGLVGLSNTLALEGRKYNVRVNTIAPIAGSRMTESVFPKELVEALKVEYVSPLVAWLAHESCEDTGGLYEVGGGFIGKLRWERTQGHTVRLGRTITPETVQKAWPTIIDFGKSTHPADVTAAIQPVVDNVNNGPSKGGNEFIDVDQALGYEMPKVTTQYDERDLSLYALGIGAAADPLDDTELRYVYEMHGKGFWPLPTFAVIPAQTGIMRAFKEGHTAPGFNFGLDRLLHGEQYTELKYPLAPAAKLTHRTWIKDIFDKGKNAFIVFATESSDESGEVVAYNELGAVIRGAGGWGGDRGPSGDVNTPPDRAPDKVVEELVRPNQALLYRLSGDWNPLHADPSFANAFGFPKPILHGLCTLGVAGRHVIKHFAGGDPRKFKSIKVRFSESVFPGETLVTEMWKESDNKVILRCKLKERDKVVLSQAAVEFYSEIPQPKPKAKPVAASAGAPAAEVVPNSADVFTAIGQYLQKNPELATKAGVVFQFRLKNPDSAWTLDLKSGKGVSAGEAASPECTLELTDADFMDMCSGKADAQKLYMGGKLKIGGNLMASTKLNFLTKLDPQSVIAAAKARAGAGGGAAPAAAEAAPAAPTSADYMAAIGEWVAANKELPAKVATVFQFRLKNPDSNYVFDLKSNPGKVFAGEVEGANCTLELSDADYMLMSTGKADPQKLFSEGKLKISGDLMASMKLGFLKKIDLSKVKGGSAPKAAAPAAAAPAAKTAQAPAILDQAASKLAGAKVSPEVTIELRVKDPDAVYFLQLGPQGGKLVNAGPATATVTIADADLAALVQGKAALQTLYQRGKLRVDGDVAAAHHLALLAPTNTAS